MPDVPTIIVERSAPTRIVKTVARGPQGAAITGPSGVLPSVKTINYTAISGDYILADTTGGSFTITLPASPAAGAAVRILGNGWATNNLTVARNGQTIEGVADDLLCNYDAELTFLFIGGTWRY